MIIETVFGREGSDDRLILMKLDEHVYVSFRLFGRRFRWYA